MAKSLIWIKVRHCQLALRKIAISVVAGSKVRAMPVQNAEIAAMFDQTADLVEIKGENQFRVRAYAFRGRPSAAGLADRG